MKKLMFLIVIFISTASFSQTFETKRFTTGYWVDGRFRYPSESHNHGKYVILSFTGNHLMTDYEAVSYDIATNFTFVKAENKYTYDCVDSKKNKCIFSWSVDKDGSVLVEITYFQRKNTRFYLMNDSKLPLKHD